MWGDVSDHDQHPLLQSDRQTWTVMHPLPKSASSHHIRDWCSLVCGCLPSIGPMYQPYPVKPTSKGSEIKNMPWVASGLTPIQCQASKTSLGWINGKLWLLLWRASTEDVWRPQVKCSGSGCLQDHLHLAEGVDVSSLPMPSDSKLNDYHDYSQNWVMVARP